VDIRLPDGRTLRGVPDGTTKAQLAAKLQSNGIEVPQEWMQPPPEPQPNLGAMNMPLMRGLGNAAQFVGQEIAPPEKQAKGIGEAALTVGSGTLATPIAGLAGLGMSVPTSPVKLLAEAAGKQFGFKVPSGAETVEGVQQALTYQPRTVAGEVATKAATFPMEAIEQGTHRAGEVVSDVTGSPGMGATAKTGLNAVALGVGARGMPKTTAARARIGIPEIERIAGETPKERAANYVNSRTSLAWDRLSRDFQRRLEEVAATGSNLEKLDATAIERQGLLASLDRPVLNPTRGQVTRDPLQQRTEQLLKATDKGAELKVRDLEQNAAILENLDILKGRTGGKAAGDVQTGQSVQGALRSRLASEEARVRNLYKEAEAAGELQGPVNIEKLVDYLKNHEDPTQVSYAMDRLKRLDALPDDKPPVPLSLKELEGIRRAAVAAGKDGGTKGHYAGELKRVLDDVTEGAGGEKYKAARSARRELGNEFERQGAIARLVEEKHMSRDRATALEDTWQQTVKSGSIEDLKNVRTSLEKSGPKGQQAWNDLRAATLDYIKDRATGGKLGLKNETGESHLTWAGLRRAVDEIGPDKLRELFGEADAKKIETIVDAVQILKTEAPTGIKGSPTADKLMTALDKIGKVPFLGKVAEGAKLVGKVKDIGKADRDLKQATTTPLDEIRP
jgi:hypothetical protein